MNIDIDSNETDVGVSIVVPTRNAGPHLNRLLASVLRQTFTRYRITVVDAQSSDDSRQIAARYGAIVLEGGSIPEARNLGFRASRSRYVLFVDADMELPPSLLDECVALISGFDAVSIPERVKGSSRWSEVRDFEKRALVNHNDFEAARFFKSEVFDALGGYDESLGNSVEDVTLQYRLLQRGFSVGHTTSVITHYEGDLGFWGYLDKRGKLSLYHVNSKYPEYWSRMTSPWGRMTVLLRFVRKSGSGRDFALCLGITLLRTIELLRRLVRRNAEGH